MLKVIYFHKNNTGTFRKAKKKKNKTKKKRSRLESQYGLKNSLPLKKKKIDVCICTICTK